MAKDYYKDRMTDSKGVVHRFHDHKTYKDSRKKTPFVEMGEALPNHPLYKPGWNNQITIPGQSTTIKELIERHETGRPQPVE